MRELAALALHHTGSRDLVVHLVVPAHGLHALARALKEATGIQLPRGLHNHHFSQWSQIQVAFEVRHLIEHRDARIDADFRSNVQNFWKRSSWGRRGDLPDVHDRITVEETDVDGTFEAMHQTARVLTDALVDWDSRQPKADDADGGTVGEDG